MIELDIEIIETSAEYTTLSNGKDVYRNIDRYNITFVINFDNKELITDIEPITIKMKEKPDSAKELETLIFKEFAKIFQLRVIR